VKPEYEARFCDTSQEHVTARLQELGAELIMPRTLMRRIVFISPQIEDLGGWLRLRDQGESITLTYKQTAGDTAAIDRILEAEIGVSDFDATSQLLQAMGFTPQRYQENYREEWHLGDVTFDIDTWPDLPTFLEIEGLDEQSVRAATAAIGLDYGQATFGSVDEVYQTRLGRDILAEPRLVFS
jgi:adenylate cyclase, class 2